MSPEYEILIQRQLSGDISEEDRIRLGDWLASDIEHRREFENWERLWRRVEAEKSEAPFDVDGGWKRLAHVLELEDGDADNEVRAKVRTQRASWRHVFVGAAAAAIVLACLGWLLMTRFWTHRQVLIVSQGLEQQRITLPDESLVNLDGASQLTFANRFSGGDREVALTGHAFFEVVEREEPFVVYTDQAIIRVLGTKFDVWSRADKTRVVVQSGKVSVVSNAAAGETILEEDQMAVCIQGKTPSRPQTVDAAALSAWVQGKLVFRHQRLDDIVLDLEALYGVDIALDGNQLGAETLNASFGDAHIDSILDEICLALELSHRMERGVHVLSRIEETRP